MNPRTSEAMRVNARFFSVVFQTLAVLTLVGTLAATVRIASLGEQIGIGASRDPATWFVLIGGLVAMFVFAGFGYTLGILCAIYDRQDMSLEEIRTLSVRDSESTLYPSRSQPAQQSVRQSVVKREEDEVVIASSNDVVSPPNASSPAPTSVARKGLWGWLTRERHLFKRDD